VGHLSVWSLFAPEYERSSLQDERRLIPRTDHVLVDARLLQATSRLGHRLVKQAVISALARCRLGELAPSEVADAAYNSLPPTATTMRQVVNATGIIVHTNLGRAALSYGAIEAITVAAGSTNVEFCLASGDRDRRGRAAMSALAKGVPEAADVHVVNNGAAALSLAACALAQNRNIVVSRGELVEIGDGFRIPELLESMGAQVREVGTTNRVHLADYQAAIDADTAFVLKVHPSNFVVSGFTSTVSVKELSPLPVPVVADIGSGLLTPHPRLPAEPSASSALRAGAQLVTASGDKLLGGPQCGLLLGNADLVRALRRHPFARALRVDKLTLAALEATLLGPVPPVAAALSRSQTELMERAQVIVNKVSHTVAASVIQSSAAVGGGGAPGIKIPSAAVALPAEFAAPLRTGEPPVVGHVEGGRLLLDLIAVPPELDRTLVSAVLQATPHVEG
jgi:L-seryl-tRNA(Ser) seleniumtransferase